jgi:hypothetical protein
VGYKPFWDRPIPFTPAIGKLGWGVYWFLVVVSVVSLLTNASIGIGFRRYVAFSDHVGFGSAGPYFFALLQVSCAALTIALSRLPKDLRYAALIIPIGCNTLDKVFATRADHLSGAANEVILWLRFGVAMLTIAAGVALWLIGRRMGQASEIAVEPEAQLESSVPDP